MSAPVIVKKGATYEDPCAVPSTRVADGAHPRIAPEWPPFDLLARDRAVLWAR